MWWYDRQRYDIENWTRNLSDESQVSRADRLLTLQFIIQNTPLVFKFLDFFECSLTITTHLDLRKISQFISTEHERCMANNLTLIKYCHFDKIYLRENELFIWTTYIFLFTWITYPPINKVVTWYVNSYLGQRRCRMMCQQHLAW